MDSVKCGLRLTNSRKRGVQLVFADLAIFPEIEGNLIFGFFRKLPWVLRVGAVNEGFSNSRVWKLELCFGDAFVYGTSYVSARKYDWSVFCCTSVNCQGLLH